MSEKKNISQRLKDLRHRLNSTQEELADRIGFTRNYISMLERGAKNPSRRFISALEIIERAPHTSEQESNKYPQREERIFVGEQVARLMTTAGKIAAVFAPLISWASAGDAHVYEDQGFTGERILTTCKDPHCYALEVEGDSMEPKHYRGDILFVMPTAEPRNGELVVARTKDDEVFFKLYHWSGHLKDKVKLTSFNSGPYPMREYRRDELRFIHPVHSVLRRLRKDT